MENPLDTRKRCIGLGEILWDLLPDGRQLGGAPANFAYHAHALGARAWPCSRVGSDTDGRDILATLRQLGLSVDGVQIDDTAPTGTVSVEMLPGGEHRFTIHEGVAWDRIEADENAIRLAVSADAVCFGTLGQRCARSRESIQTIVKAVPSAALRIFDINFRQRFYSPEVIAESFEIANVLKINHEELPVLASILALQGSPEEQIAALAKRFHLRLVALTRGANGSLLYAGGRVSDQRGIAVELVDSIGAGDAFTAAMALGWLAGRDLEVINRDANAVASFVCSQRGATPALPPGLSARFE